MYPAWGLPRQARGLRAKLLVAALTSGALLLVGPPAATAGPAVSSTTPVTYAGTNLCTGEAFTGTGTMHFLLSGNLSTSGVLQHHLDVSIDGLQAVTLTGKKYVVQDTYSDEYVFGGADEENFDITVHYIRVGEDGTFILGDDFYERLHTHITANDNGVVTVSDVQATDMPCR